MSWFNTSRRRIICAGLAALTASSCGFRPLYGPEGAQDLFGAVKVDAPSEELGFRLREALVKRLGPARPDASLTLILTAAVDRNGLAIEQDDSITRYNLTLTVAYRLVSDSGRGATGGSVETVAAYNAVASQYQTLTADREVLARAAEDAADRIIRELSANYDPAWLAP